MKRREFLSRAAAGAAFAAASPAAQSPAGAHTETKDSRLKLLFMDRRDVQNTWGLLRFGSTAFTRIGDPPQKEFIVKYCHRLPDGTYDVWGFKGADKHPWKLLRCRSRDGVHFEDVRVLLERSEANWAHTCSVSYSPELGRYLFLKNMNVDDGFSMYAYSSTDGDHWQEYPNNPVFYEGDRWGGLWSSAAQRFVYYGKGIQRFEKRFPELFSNARRVITQRSSADGFHWVPDSPAFYRRNANNPPGQVSGRRVGGPLVPEEFQLSPDELDPPDLEFYAGDGFLYEGRYYMLMLNYAASVIPPGTPPVAANGHGPALDTEWWISRDGLHWDRPFREMDAGPMFIHHNPMIAGGRMLFHTEDGLWAIPEDRITYVTARATGVFDTLQFLSDGKPLKLNARVPGKGYSSYENQGYVMAELIDDSDRIFPGYEKEHCILQATVDAPDIPMRWSGKDGSELQGKRMRVRFYLRGADIFAVTT